MPDFALEAVPKNHRSAAGGSDPTEDVEGFDHHLKGHEKKKRPLGYLIMNPYEIAILTEPWQSLCHEVLVVEYGSLLGGGNSNIFGMFIPIPGDDDPIFDEHIFQMGWFNHQLE